MSAAGPCDGMNASPPTAQATINAAASFIAKEVRKHEVDYGFSLAMYQSQKIWPQEAKMDNAVQISRDTG
jgi:hypothetical protein